MTFVLFSAMRKREKVLNLNEEIVRKNENLATSPYDSYTNTEDKIQKERVMTGIDIDDDPDFEFYAEDNIKSGGLIGLVPN